ncbi:MAG: class I SAM-dependent RNA methyltransferase [Acidimicrobiia bacterium]|nr:class I SAM-dependent RNA methyltransferase [Acidimicrobiia bacterium]
MASRTGASDDNVLTLDVEKAVAGGRMLARHAGGVVLLWGAIPGERVRARVDRTAKGVVYATTVDVVTSSPDRRGPVGDWRCGGNVYAHIAYDRQLRLKGEVIADALSRIGRTPAEAPDVAGSPESGYRMRARLHARGGRLGFFREESHDLCHARGTGQLREDTCDWLERLAARADLGNVVSVEVAENVAASERVCHVEIARGDAGVFEEAALDSALSGFVLSRPPDSGFRQRLETRTLRGSSWVEDDVAVPGHPQGLAVRLRRDVRGFFQGNRFLLDRLAAHVISLIPPGPVVDLYAGVGLFGLLAAAAGRGPVTLVEGDPVAGADLEWNATRVAGDTAVASVPVERYLAAAVPRAAALPLESTLVADPPRTGLSREAVQGIVRLAFPRVVLVSCDPPTMARDLRTLRDAGHDLAGLQAFDLFPNTAHVEVVALLVRSRAPAA